MAGYNISTKRANERHTCIYPIKVFIITYVPVYGRSNTKQAFGYYRNLDSVVPV